ncbi:hypothetical protein [Actinomadura sp. B10D3]|uniref:tetratricopeptide repeat protein n=1 Tax=Actinomadura sp. B10D3 TaxID=3153557 RepID=UPI00325CB418
MAMPRWLAVRLFFFGTRMYLWGRYGMAGRAFRLVVERGPEHWSPVALKWLGDSLRMQGHIGRAQEAYRRCIEMGVYSDSADAALSLARLREEVQGDADGAIDAYYTALRLGEMFALDPLISLLDARGDKDEANALLAKANLRSQISEALDQAGHHHAHDRAKNIHGYVIAALDPMETVEHVAWTLADHEDWDRRPDGYLILTDQRLLLLDDFHYPSRYHGRHLPDYVLLAVDRNDVDSARASRDDDGTWSTVESGFRFRARIHDDPEPWIKALKPRDGERP